MASFPARGRDGCDYHPELLIQTRIVAAMWQRNRKPLHQHSPAGGQTNGSQL